MFERLFGLIPRRIDPAGVKMRLPARLRASIAAVLGPPWSPDGEARSRVVVSRAVVVTVGPVG